MREKTFPLGTDEDIRAVKYLRILFGVACIAMGIYWIVYSLKSEKADWSLWVSILFLLAFGGYQIWAGIGRAIRYIEFDTVIIKLKKSSLRNPEILHASDLTGIEILPLSIIFKKGEGKNTLLRLGAVHYETNEKIIDELIIFAERNNIGYEIKADDI